MITLYTFTKRVIGVTGILLASQAQAITYTALVSGSFSSSGTWGGASPTVITSGDVVRIPAGVNVTLDADLDMNGTLKLNSGTLALNGHNLNFNSSADLITTGTGNIDADPASGIFINTTNGLTSPLTFINGDVLGNLSIMLSNGTGNIDLGSDILIAGTLGLGSGTLSLNDNKLTFAANGDFSPAGTGSFIGTSGSDIGVQTSSSITGALRFSPQGNYLRNLFISFPDPTNTVALASDLNITGNLILTSGKINTGASDLSMMPGSVVIGGSETSYIIAGQGIFTVTSVANTANVFPIGTSTSYCPALVFSGAGSSTGQLSLSVRDGVFENGYSGTMLTGTRPLVNATWYLTTSVTAGLDLTLQCSWNADMELNGFDRSQAYVAHNTNGHWDMATTASAGDNNGMYSIIRSGITSGGPFTVADNNSALEVGKIATKGSAITIYPNPATEALYFSAPAAVTKADIYDITGRIIKSFKSPGNALAVQDLAPGHYTVRLDGKDFVSVEKFLKTE